ncbi:Histone-lysine N-methyltransferase SETMAR [Eumeta japonica]|uniref:Histone-lysine N-methyltransferase SETMAR n=1 Tax=Eumeta variegata TaxID=151549 RepID=A0A4C1SU69_EUMVA|nr:Histone-lysine N-methyltransferase SETMAR [Eumeta japonica]
MNRLLICDSLLKRNETESFLKILTTCDEKWMTYDKNVLKRSWSKDKQAPQTIAKPGVGGWSVTVAGNCHTALPADVEMRLRFPKGPAQQATSQSDSGFGDDARSRPIAAPHRRRAGDTVTAARAPTP